MDAHIYYTVAYGYVVGLLISMKSESDTNRSNAIFCVLGLVFYQNTLFLFLVNGPLSQHLDSRTPGNVGDDVQVVICSLICFDMLQI
jgi:hypothetical protein